MHLRSFFFLIVTHVGILYPSGLLHTISFDMSWFVLNLLRRWMAFDHWSVPL